MIIDIEILKQLSYNVNLDLLLDKFVIEMDGVNSESLQCYIQGKWKKLLFLYLTD